MLNHETKLSTILDWSGLHIKWKILHSRAM